MTQIQISQTLADRLAKIAALKQRSLDEVVEEILKSQVPETSGGDEAGDVPPGSAAAFIRAALAADIHTGEHDVAERSREILEQEFPEYLRQRLHKSDSQDDSTHE